MVGHKNNGGVMCPGRFGLQKNVRKSMKSDLKGVYKIHVENPFFQICSYGLLVAPGPLKPLKPKPGQ